MISIGKRVTEEEWKRIWESHKKAIIIYKECKVIEPQELYTPQGPTTLNWEVLAELERRSGANGSILLPGYCSGFRFCLGELIDNAPAGRFTKSIEKNCWVTFGHQYGGIPVHRETASDPHGRRGWVEDVRYPMIKEDIEGYIKYFLSRTCGEVYAAQIHSVPNRDWWDKKGE